MFAPVIQGKFTQVEQLLRSIVKSAIVRPNIATLQVTLDDIRGISCVA